MWYKFQLNCICSQKKFKGIKLIWIHRNSPRGFEDLSLAEMLAAGLTQVSNRYFFGENFDIQKSAYGQFSVREVSRGSSAKEAITNFSEDIPSPYRMEKFENKRRSGSLTYAMLAEEIHGGNIRATDPKSIILVFSPDNIIWIAGFVTERKNSLVHKLQTLTERTCVSLTSQAALALINITETLEPIIDPCCGTGMIPLAAVLLKKETYASDKNLNMLRMAKANRDTLGVDLEIRDEDAFSPWMHGCCLVSDFPADRSWSSNTEDLSLKLFTSWIPFIKSFCVIVPTQILAKLPNTITITKKIAFTANRTIILGVIKKDGTDIE
jgi:hypothetical protein